MISRSLLAGGLLLAAFSTHAGVVADVAYLRGASAPWGQTTNEAAMDLAFGAGNWADLRMADGPAPFQPGSGFRFIFLEGGDSTALELDAYLNANRAVIEAFVSAGGRLLLNAAPNQGGDINFGFGGHLLNYNAGAGFFSDTVTAANAAHPVFVGPFTPVVTDYTGHHFGHAIIDGPLAPIILSNDVPPPPVNGPSPASAGAIPQGGGGVPPFGSVVLGELTFGSGCVLLGGMTTDNFHDPQPEAANLRANILDYTANNANCVAGGNGTLPPPAAVPAIGIGGLLALFLLVAFGAGVGLSRRPA